MPFNQTTFQMKKSLLVALAAVLSLQVSAQERKVLFIGVDGVRSDALIVANTPTWDSLCAAGLYTYTSWHVGITVSGPSWSSMLTGVWQGKHGVTNNNYTGSDFNNYPYFVTRAKEYRPDLKAVQITSWDPMSSAVYNDGWDSKIVVPTDDACEAAAIATLSDPELDILFVHIDDCDAQGHGNGFSPTVTPYMNQVEYVDTQLRSILNALRARPNYTNEEWMVIMTTDHGGIGTGHGGPTRVEREIWWVAAGPGVPQAQISIDLPSVADLFPDPSDYRNAPMLTDIAVTALDYLLEQDIDDLIAEWDLDGQSWLDYSTFISDAEGSKLEANIFPNPNNGEFELVMGDMNDDVKWSIIDLSGRVLREGVADANLGQRIHFDVRDLPAGVYSLSVVAGNSSAARRVVVR
jgi:hypothetical protein